ncbi:MAG: hypothetical protein PHQ58_20205 [Rhodoferax sp.]|nr:hypothetical protein [Rhodoferax sp.]MDD2882747.1 hypothetical protein [Rhodoferax sp.]
MDATDATTQATLLLIDDATKSLGMLLTPPGRVLPWGCKGQHPC